MSEKKLELSLNNDEIKSIELKDLEELLKNI